MKLFILESDHKSLAEQAIITFMHKSDGQDFQNFLLIFIVVQGKRKLLTFCHYPFRPQRNILFRWPTPAQLQQPSSGRGPFLPSIVFASCYLLRQGRKAGTWSQGHAPHFGIVGTLMEVLRPPLPAGIV